jgi:uncharacterized membrane protein
MSPFPKRLKELCSPALFYFVLSMVGLVLAAWQNMGRRNTYVLGGMTRTVPNTGLVFVVKIIYILFWTWILNLICKDGHTSISWFLVLIPFILLFSVVFLLMVSPYAEGLESKDKKGMVGYVPPPPGPRMEGFGPQEGGKKVGCGTYGFPCK